MAPEIVPIVDSRDCVIGFKDRHELLPADINRATALWVENSAGQVLLARRSALKKNNPNRWSCAAAGTVGQDESYDESVIREAEEELGITGIEPILVTKILASGYNNHFLQLYRATLDLPLEAFRLQVEEVSEIRWFDKEEIIKLHATDPDQFTNAIHEWLPLFMAHPQENAS